MFNKEKPVELVIDKEKCTNCAQCVSVCPAGYLLFEDNTIKANPESAFGCIQCGHCMMDCPNDAIKIKGEGVSKSDIIPLTGNLPSYESLNPLFISRRSIRKFKNQEVPQEIVNKILDSASTAAIGIPPSEVRIVVINGFDKVQEFAADMTETFEKMIKTMNPFMLSLLKPFIGANQHKFLKDFVLPLAKTTVDERKEGRDRLFYNAPAVIIFCGSAAGDKEDQIIAATHATLAAESLGLGTCIIGSVAPMLERNKQLKQKYGILGDETPSTAFILGYPDIKFLKGIKRNFKSVKYY